MLLNVIIFGVLFAVSTAYLRLSTLHDFTHSEAKCNLKHSNLAIVSGRLVTGNENFENGQANCKKNQPEDSALAENCWTGLTRDPGAPWYWIDGTTDIALPSYGFSGTGEPANNAQGNPWYIPDGSTTPEGTGNCVVFNKEYDYKWTITDCSVDAEGVDVVAYPLCNLRKHQFEKDCSCIDHDQHGVCVEYEPKGGCTDWATGSCTTGCGLADGSCTCSGTNCSPSPSNYFIGGNGKVYCKDGTDCALITCECSTTDCTLFDKNTCIKPGCDIWVEHSSTDHPRYYTNGVVVALVGAIRWNPTVLAMGTGTQDNNIMLHITEPNDCPYFAQEFSVTNVDGIDCVVRVEPAEDPTDHGCYVRLESWSTPIVYVKAGSKYSAKSWFVENVQTIVEAGVKPTAQVDIFRFLSEYNDKAAGDPNGDTLWTYSWVQFDGIVWISQGSNLAGGSDMLQPIYQPEVQPEPEPEPVSFGLENNKKLENKFSKWVVYGDSLFITILIVVIASSFFGLCGGIGIKLVSMRMNKIYYQKLVQKDIDSP